MDIGRLDEVALIFKNTERSLYDLNIPNLKLEHSELKIKLYELLGDRDGRSLALEEFYINSMVQKKERESSYKFFTSIRKKLSEMEKENTMLLKRAETDSLTGLGNRYALNRFADKAFENAYFSRQPLAVEILDVDNFKRYNDTYGHQAGDECLKKIGNEINKICSGSENVHGFRYGGDEFVIIYENLSDEQVMEYALSLRSQVTSMKIESSFANTEGILSISQGIRNSVPLETNKLWDYMYAADNALYDVKDHKKGEIVLLHKASISQTSLNDARHS